MFVKVEGRSIDVNKIDYITELSNCRIRLTFSGGNELDLNCSESEFNSSIKREETINSLMQENKFYDETK